jgi:hypothetical protein
LALQPGLIFIHGFATNSNNEMFVIEVNQNRTQWLAACWNCRPAC